MLLRTIAWLKMSVRVPIWLPAQGVLSKSRLCHRDLSDCAFCVINCSFGYIGGGRKAKLGERAYSSVCSVYFSLCRVLLKS